MNAVFGCQGLYNHDRQRERVGALCLVPYFQHSYLLAPPSPRCETEEEDVAHCVNKSPQCAFLCLHVPWPARATNHASGSLS